MLMFLVLYIFMSVIVIATRLLDEVLFPSYRKIEINKPVFIIANPRSGTTYLHRLFCLDGEKYNYTLLYHTIFPSITLFKIIDFFGWIDRRTGRPLRKFFDFLDSKLFKGWENIHPMGFNKSEEDEGTYVFTMITAGIFLLCPYLDEIPWVKFPDKMSERARRSLMEFYKSTIQRVAYAQGHQKIFLSKNVMSTGRLASLLEYFPSARIVYIVRNPYSSVPSFISMFSSAWRGHSKDIPENSPHHRAWGQLGMDYYTYFHEKIKLLDERQTITLKYDDLVQHPVETVLSVYEKFDLGISESFITKLKSETSKQKSYRSDHDYSLEQFGMSKQEVLQEIEWVFDKYEFSKN